MIVAQGAEWYQVNVCAASQTITDTGGTGRSVSPGATPSSFSIAGGTGSTAATASDYALGTPVSGSSGTATATVAAYSGSGSSGTFKVTATITNTSGSTIDYQEFGITVSDGTYTYLLTHDVLSASIAVPNGQGIGVTYTLTWS